MSKPRAADDFATIRSRLEELKREREPKPPLSVGEADGRCCRQHGTQCTGACD